MGDRMKFRAIIVVIVCTVSFNLMHSKNLSDNVSQAKIRAVIFDCDGVLVDTEYLKLLSWQHVLKKHNIDFSLQDYVPLVGYSGNYILGKISEKYAITFPSSVCTEICVERNVYYKTLQNKGVPVIQAAVDFAKALALQKQLLGIKIGLASSAERHEVMENLKQAGLSDVFDVIVSGKDDLAEYHDVTGTNKPKPYVYQKTAKLLGLEPSECLVFEDTQAGIVAGADAGMFVIAVPNDYTKTQDFSRARLVIASCADLSATTLLSTVLKDLL